MFGGFSICFDFWDLQPGSPKGICGIRCHISWMTLQEHILNITGDLHLEDQEQNKERWQALLSELETISKTV